MCIFFRTLCVTLFFIVRCSSTYGQAPRSQIIPSLNLSVAALRDSTLEPYMDSIYFSIVKLPRPVALAQAQTTIDFCEQNNLQHALVYAYLNMADLENSATSYTWHQKALTLANDIHGEYEIMLTYARMAHFQQQKHLRSEALQNILVAIRYAKALRQTEKSHDYLMKLMTFYLEAGNNARATETARELMATMMSDHASGHKNRSELSMLMSLENTLALSYRNQGQYDSAEINFNRAKKIALELEDEFWTNLIEGNRADIYIARGEYDKAIPGLKADIGTSKKHQVWSSAVGSYLLLGKVYLLKGQPDLAGVYLDSAKHLHDKYLGDREISVRFWELLADVEHGKGNDARAWTAQKRFIAEKILALQKQESDKVAKVQGAFDLESKQNEIELLLKNGHIQSEQYKRQHTLLVSVGIVLVLSFLLIISVIRSYRRQKRATTIAARQRDEIAGVHAQLNTAYEELKVAQHQLVQTEKMVFLGQLTSGVAHEINTPLGAIQASSQNIRGSVENIRKKMRDIPLLLPPDFVPLFLELINLVPLQQQGVSFKEQRQLKKMLTGELKNLQVAHPEIMAEYCLNIGATQALEKWKPLLLAANALDIFVLADDIASLTTQRANIDLAVSKASKIVFALKSYARQDEHYEAVDVDLAENIEVVLSIYAHNLKQITVDVRFEDVPCIKGYPEELNQVWTNLIYNALQAMGAVNGRLEIRIVQRPSGEIVVEIEDNGSGIAPEHQAKLFTPFFTTKLAGEGTGLGLPIVKKIVEKHKARVEFESELNKGTTFRVIFAG